MRPVVGEAWEDEELVAEFPQRSTDDVAEALRDAAAVDERVLTLRPAR
ncbi:MAG: hypothetical protein ACYCTE_01055 [Acidimicrobiales bacterium]